jgi:LPS-assembly lipoprotein
MSSSEGEAGQRGISVGAGMAAAILAVGLLGAACTARPLYSDAVAPGASAPMAAQLASVSVMPVSNRQAQEVRNQLIFLLGGGQGDPDAAAYTLDLAITSQSTASVVQVSTIEQAPTASLLTMTAFYTLAESANGRVIATGRRQVASAYDVPEQRFAALRSERDAENRAARELAEQLHMAIAQDLSRGG